MGMFDTLICHYSLPGLPDPTSVEFHEVLGVFDEAPHNHPRGTADRAL